MGITIKSENSSIQLSYNPQSEANAEEVTEVSVNLHFRCRDDESLFQSILEALKCLEIVSNEKPAFNRHRPLATWYRLVKQAKQVDDD